jgi:tRNA threonylcarbamoyladenosine biosynthesis protein TsaB
MKDSGVTFKELDAIAVSRGPGSYTGLRIGASAAKGFAFALSKPLIAVDTLLCIAAAANLHTPKGATLCPMIDARRMEVYTATYDQQLSQLSGAEALIIDEKSIERFNGHKCYFMGNGMDKCRTLLSMCTDAHFIEGIKPSAADMVPLSHKRFTEKKFEDAAYFEPFYLKDFIAGVKKGS